MITKAAFLLFRGNEDNRELLLARAKGKPHYVFPGGKQEAGETIELALQRELQEELGTGAHDITKVGVVNGHTPDGRELEMHLFTGQLEGEPSPHSEIEELTWMNHEMINKKRSAMTPMFLDHVLPFLATENLW